MVLPNVVWCNTCRIFYEKLTSSMKRVHCQKKKNSTAKTRPIYRIETAQNSWLWNLPLSGADPGFGRVQAVVDLPRSSG